MLFSTSEAGPRFRLKLGHGLSTVLAIAVVSAVWLAAGAPGAHGATAAQASRSESDTAADTNRSPGARISGIDIDLTFDPETGRTLQQARIEVTGSNVQNLTFEINPWLNVEHATSSDGMVEHRKAGRQLRVLLSPRLNGTRTLKFRITGRARRGAEYLVQPDRVILSGGDRWYPVLPDTWARAQVTVKTPPGWTAVGPGRRVDGTEEGVWRWRTDRPVRSVGLVVAPDLTLSEGTAIRTPVTIAAPGRGIPAEPLATLLSNSMAWFSAALGPYPFDSFNLVFLPGLSHRVRASGMLALPVDTPLDTAGDGADLLAGQWFGERLAGNGVWMDSFAAWYATVFTKDRALALPGEISQLRQAYFELPSRNDVPLSRADVTTPPAVVRGKGSAAPDMIRLSVGDRRTHDAIRDLFEAPVSPPVSLQEVRSVFEKHAGSTLLRFFADWFDRRGVPELKTQLRTRKTSGGDWRVDLTVTQLRGNYALPVEVVFVGRGQEHRETVHVDGEMTSVFYILPFQPLRVEIDPYRKLFMRKTE